MNASMDATNNSYCLNGHVMLSHSSVGVASEQLRRGFC